MEEADEANAASTAVRRPSVIQGGGHPPGGIDRRPLGIARRLLRQRRKCGLFQTVQASDASPDGLA